MHKNKFLTDRVAKFIVFIWPFIFLYKYILADTSFSEFFTLDVIHFYYPKLYLLAHLDEGRLPFWSPVEAAGFPFFSSPFNQVFYPLNLLMLLYYKITGGFSWVDYQRWAILGVSMFSFNLYGWLRSLKINILPALFTVLILCASYKVTGTVNRLPATHGLAWLTLVIWGMTVAIKANKLLKGSLMVGIGLLLLVSNIYPYYIYYSLFIIPFYYLALVIRSSRIAFTEIKELKVVKYTLSLIVAALIPAIICLPYLLQIKYTQSLLSTRGEASELYTKSAIFELNDTLASFVFPPCSDMRGWYFFGFIGLFMVIIFLINHFYQITKKPSNKVLLAVLFGYFFFISMITYGNSFLFDLFLNYFPGFKNFRTWGRLNVLMIFIFAIPIAKGFSIFFNVLFHRENLVDNYELKHKKFLLILSSCYAIILSLQFYFIFFDEFTYIWRIRVLALIPDFNNYIYLVTSTIAFLFTIGAIKFASSQERQLRLFNKVGKNTVKLGLVVAMVLFSSFDMGHTSIQLRSHPTINYYTKNLTPPPSVHLTTDTLNIHTKKFKPKAAEGLVEAFDLPKYVDYNKQINLPVFFNKDEHRMSVRSGITWFINTYTTFVEKNCDKIIPLREWRRLHIFSEDLKEFMGMYSGKKIYFSDKINYEYQEIDEFLIDSNMSEKDSNFAYEMVHYNGDVLDIISSSEKEGYISFIDNWCEGWEVEVNGNSADIELLFGTFKAVEVPAGINEIRFIYRPKYFSMFVDVPKTSFTDENRERLMKAIDRNKKTQNSPLKGKMLEEDILQLSLVSDTITLENPIKWTNTTGVTITDNLITNNNQVLWGYAGASSENVLPSKTDGVVEMIVKEDNTNRIVGFAKKDIDFGYTNIDYALHINSRKELGVFYLGKSQKMMQEIVSYETGDTLRIERIDGKIIFRKNREAFYLSKKKYFGELILDASFLSKDASLYDCKASF